MTTCKKEENVSNVKESAIKKAVMDAKNANPNPSILHNNNGTRASSSSSASQSADDKHEQQHMPEPKRTKRRGSDLHVEAMVHPCSTTPFAILQKEVETFILALGQSSFTYPLGQPVDISNAPSIIQSACIQLVIYLDDPMSSLPSIASWTIRKVHVYTYTLTDSPPEPEELDDGNVNEEPITVCHTLQLPHTTLHTAWDNLIFPPSIKTNLLSYAFTGLHFSQKNVSTHVINWNRVLLLHGPPGTGKTTLCRALAHKLCIRMQHSFPAGGYLLEVQSHSLFSKWFSESGKLISRLFGRIREMVEDEPQALFCVLIDEIESLASSRMGNGGGGAAEPSDAVRAVNSLLTSLDSIRSLPNVIILSTTNMTHCVDSAFVDRVDWTVKIGLPSLEARYEILRSCVNELCRVGVVNGRRQVLEDRQKEGTDTADGVGSKTSNNGNGDFNGNSDMNVQGYSEAVQRAQEHNVPKTKTSTTASGVIATPETMLLECAETAKGLSGRGLRKLPFQSHAFHLRSVDEGDNVDLLEFIGALLNGIKSKQKGEI